MEIGSLVLMHLYNEQRHSFIKEASSGATN